MENVKNWYEAKTGNHQGLIIEEKSGINIAVCYDKKHAPLIAGAPEMYEALQIALRIIEAESEACGIYKAHTDKIRNAINKADGK